MKKVSKFIKDYIFGGGARGTVGSAEGKDAKRHRCEVNLEGRKLRRYEDSLLTENSFFLPFLGNDKRMGNNQYPPQPSLIREGVTCHCEGVKRPSQSQDSCNKNEITTSNAPHSPRNDKFSSRFTLHPSLKKTYRPNVLSSYRLKNKFSLRFTLHSSPKKRAAFTLAEVLITLGIIGVVAAMTIPGMIVKHQKQVTAKRLEQTYSILYQAVNHAQADYGDISSWGMVGSTSIDQDNPTQVQDLITSFADKYLVPYLKLTSSPLYSNNIARQGYVYPKTKDGRSYSFNNAYILELPNSSTLFIAYNMSGIQNIYTLPIIFVDINGKQGPNIVGRDFFMFSFDGADTMKLLPAGYSFNRDTLKDYCAEHTSGREYENLYCTALIMFDGWEIKDDYPW